jgi:hypothetical protein
MICSRVEPASKKGLLMAQNRFDPRPLKHAFLPLQHENRGIHLHFFPPFEPIGQSPHVIATCFSRRQTIVKVEPHPVQLHPLSCKPKQQEKKTAELTISSLSQLQSRVISAPFCPALETRIQT